MSLFKDNSKILINLLIIISIITKIFSYYQSSGYSNNNNQNNQNPNNNDQNFISRAYNLTSYSQLNSFLKQKKTTFIYFYSNYCSGCSELLHSFQKASSYEFIYNFTNILLVNCNKYKDICFQFDLQTLPCLSIYYFHPEYKTLSIINQTFYSYEFEDIIKLIQKFPNPYTKNKKYPGLMKLKSKKDINKFSNEFGDVSFLLILDKKGKNNKKLLSCFNNDIALNKNYITKFYFGYTYNTNTIKKNFDYNNLPIIFAMGVNYNDFGLHIEVENCNDIQKFIEINEFPIFKNFDNKYLFKLMKLKKTIIIFVIDKKKLSALPRLISKIQRILLKRRDLIFGYMDLNEDISMLSFFNIKSNVLDETMIIYDFQKGRYHLSHFEELEKEIEDLDSGILKWKSGYFIEDFLGKLGINVNRGVLMLVFFGIFTIIIIFGCIFCFTMFERIDKKLR